MPRFVVLEHDYPEAHWDFMLETEEHLRTWKLLDSPDSLTPIKVEVSFDHRLIYLDYEGTISQGRGKVKRFDHGTFEWVEQNDLHVIVRLDGQKLNGLIKLTNSQLSFLGSGNNVDTF